MRVDGNQVGMGGPKDDTVEWDTRDIVQGAYTYDDVCTNAIGRDYSVVGSIFR